MSLATEIADSKFRVDGFSFPAVWLSRPFEDETQAEIRAVRHDNHRDAKRLVELFVKHAGDSYPQKWVYERHFWCDAAAPLLSSDTFTSLVAIHSDKFIAHLALQHLRTSNALEILLPAFDPDYHADLIKLFRYFWQVVEQQAKRQHRSIVMQYHSTQRPLFQFVAAKCFRSYPVALIPSISPTDRSDSLALDTQLLTACLIDEAPVGDAHPLFPPQAYSDIIEGIFSGLSLPRVFLPAANKEMSGISTLPLFGSRHPGLAFVHHNILGIIGLRVVPSRAEKEKCLKKIDFISRRCAGRGFAFHVQVSLNDPQCPQFCKMLEDQGYRFSGVLPTSGLVDFIVYARLKDSDLAQMRLYAKPARALRDRILAKK